MVMVMSTGNVILFSTHFIIVFLHERSIIINITGRYYIIFRTLLLVNYHITIYKNRLITSIEIHISTLRTFRCDVG